MYHPIFNLKHWELLFPLARFEKRRGPRQFDSTKPGDPLDLWKAHGRIISSPVDLAVTEQVRERAAQFNDLGTAVPVDIFVWRVGAPRYPFLTKIGGVPYRSKHKPWPRSRDGKPMTFIVQFCFVDSKDIVPRRLPGDVLLVFFKEADSYFGDGDDIHIEWSRRGLSRPMSKASCPPPGFDVPELAGVIHRTYEYPFAEEGFAKLGHYQYWLFGTTQSTKVGQITWFIQGDRRGKNQSLLCTFNSLQIAGVWPFTNRRTPPSAKNLASVHAFGGKFSMMFGDVGCMYFLIDSKGRVCWEWDCY